MFGRKDVKSDATRSIFSKSNNSIRYRLIAHAANESGGIHSLRFKGKNIVLVSDPIIAKELHTKHASSLIRRGPINNLVRLIIGDSLLTINGDEWLSLRQKVNPSLSDAAVSSYLPTLVRLYSDKYDRLICSSGSRICGVSREEILRIQYAATARIVFGRELETNDLEGLLYNDFNSFRYVGEFRPGSLHLPSWIPLTMASKIVKSSSESTRILDRYNKEFNSRMSVTSGETSLLALYELGENANKGCPLGFEQKKRIDFIRTLFYSATLTTAMTLEWALRVLSSNGDLLNLITREVDLAIRDDSQIIEALPSLHICKSFILEVTRLFSVIPSVLKSASADIDISGKLEIKRGSVVITSIHGIHTNPEYWDDPLTFRYDRFLNSVFPHEAFWPFSFGAHVCPGKSLALAELLVSLVLIVRRFTVLEKPGIDLNGCCQGIVVVPAMSSVYGLERR